MGHVLPKSIVEKIRHGQALDEEEVTYIERIADQSRQMARLGLPLVAGVVLALAFLASTL